MQHILRRGLALSGGRWSKVWHKVCVQIIQGTCSFPSPLTWKCHWKQVFLPCLSHTWHFADLAFQLWLPGFADAFIFLFFCIIWSSALLSLNYSQTLTCTCVIRCTYMLKCYLYITCTITEFYLEWVITNLLHSLPMSLANKPCWALLEEEWAEVSASLPHGSCYVYVLFLLRSSLFCDIQSPRASYYSLQNIWYFQKSAWNKRIIYNRLLKWDLPCHHSEHPVSHHFSGFRLLE